MSVSIDNRPIMVFRNCPGTLGDVNPLRNKGLRFPPRRKLASKRVQNTTLGAIAQKNTSIYQWVGVPGQLPFIFSGIWLFDRLLRNVGLIVPPGDTKKRPGT